MSGSVVTLFVGSLAYLISTFLGGYCWHLVVFNDAYASLKAWTKFDDPVIPLGFAACALQVKNVGTRPLIADLVCSFVIPSS